MGYWPEDWRDRGSKGKDKRLSQLARYASPEAAMDALFAAQDRIRSGELMPRLGKNPSADEIKEWREANGIPESADKYDFGKDFKVEEADKPLVDLLKKAGHASDQTPKQVAATIGALKNVTKALNDQRAAADSQLKEACEESLRSEWGGEFKKNVNLIHGLLDFTGGAKGVRESMLNARMPDGKKVGDSPEAMRLLLNVAMIQNPTGVVVPGGTGATGEGLKGELDKLQKIPAAKKSEAQSQRERDLIGAAVKAGHMDSNGQWKS